MNPWVGLCPVATQKNFPTYRYVGGSDQLSEMSTIYNSSLRKLIKSLEYTSNYFDGFASLPPVGV